MLNDDEWGQIPKIKNQKVILKYDGYYWGITNNFAKFKSLNVNVHEEMLFNARLKEKQLSIKIENYISFIKLEVFFKMVTKVNSFIAIIRNLEF